MRSYIVRHWTGILNTWISIVNSLTVYLISTMIVVIGAGQVRGAALALALVLVIGIWFVPNVIATVGTMRSAFRAIGHWHHDKIEALGAIVAIVMIGFAIYFVSTDLSVLL